MVRLAFVTAVRELPASEEQTPDAGPMMPAITELTVRFEDGNIRSFNIEPGELFQPGERVIVTSRNSNTYITHD